MYKPTRCRVIPGRPASWVGGGGRRPSSAAFALARNERPNHRRPHRWAVRWFCSRSSGMTGPATTPSNFAAANTSRIHCVFRESLVLRFLLYVSIRLGLWGRGDHEPPRLIRALRKEALPIVFAARFSNNIGDRARECVNFS